MELKREAVRLSETSGKSIAQVARELGVSDTSIYQWRKELAAQGSEAFPGRGLWRKKIGDSNGNWSAHARNAIF
ncbi:hypothetical protein EPA93_15390 [Ktedonosporobacter rubrisoli]|uniref:Uncharacterized protein n=1 Tax=Ktedonosporobacter rubrisoli TaxID=2509675 RepID=A0A4P6JQ50_KTERU|nr:hypothetical protein EPA93_15390 [Ktedonosporobacter rubrisoli]